MNDVEHAETTGRGWVKLSVEVLLDAKMSASAKVVYAYLQHRQGDNAAAWPGLRRIAGDVALSLWAVKRAVAMLEARGWLEVARPDQAGRGHVNRYVVVAAKGSETDTFTEGKGLVSSPLGAVKGSETDTQKGRKPTLNKNHTRTNSLSNEREASRVARDSVRLAGILLDLILERKPDYRDGRSDKRKQTVGRWGRDIDLAIRRDGRDPAKIESVIRWAQNDGFWRDNILSGGKLREKFDRLEMQMQKGGTYHERGTTAGQNDRAAAAGAGRRGGAGGRIVRPPLHTADNVPGAIDMQQR